MILNSDTSTPKVIEVKENSPANQGGIKPGDVILEVGDHKIGQFGDLVEALKMLPGEKSTTFKVLRDLDRVELTIVPKFVE
jgi:S1-C subfamily serine protease